MKQRSRARANIHVCTEHSFSEAPLQPTQLLCSVLGRVQAPHAEAPSTLQYESESESRSGVSKSFRPMDYTVHGILQARILEWGAAPFSRGSSQSKDRTQVFALQADSLQSEPPGKPKNTGVGSLFLLQWIFRTQESNRGLLPCRRILYQLSYPGRQQILQINVRTLALTLTDMRSHWTALSREVMLLDLHLNTISLIKAE